MSHSCIITDHRPIKVWCFSYTLTFVWAVVLYLKHALNNWLCDRCLRSCQLHAWQALLESVDCWPMAIIIHQTFGGKPKLVTVLTGVTSGRYPPPERCYVILW
jgi:hypothetical protein